MDPSKFKHKVTVSVRFNEVDMLGVCNNAVYLNYFEYARLEYIRDAGLMPEGRIFSNGILFFIVRNELNYKAHSHYRDELNIYSKIAYIKNSSFGFDHLIENVKTKEVIVEGSGVIVQVDSKTKKSLPLTDEFFKKVKKFQGEVNRI